MNKQSEILEYINHKLTTEGYSPSVREIAKAEIGLMIQKRSGDIQEFNYEKLYKGIENAFGGLDINDKKLKTLVDNIHNEIKTQGNKIKSEIVGETVLKYLKETNEVAYLRFASVYKEFSDASDFEKEVAEL